MKYVACFVMLFLAYGLYGQSKPESVLGFPPDTTDRYAMLSSISGITEGRAVWVDSATMAQWVGVGAGSNGIYGGSGNVSDGTVATLLGDFDFDLAPTSVLSFDNIRIGDIHGVGLNSFLQLEDSYLQLHSSLSGTSIVDGLILYMNQLKPTYWSYEAGHEFVSSNIILGPLFRVLDGPNNPYFEVFDDGQVRFNQYSGISSGLITYSLTDRYVAVIDTSDGGFYMIHPDSLGGSGGGSDGYVQDVKMTGNNLVFTGVGNAFNSQVDLSQFLTSEVDGSVTNELQTITESSPGQVTLSDGGGTVDLTDNFLTSEVDGSVTNEAWTIDADDTSTELITNQTVKFEGSGGIATDYNPTTNILEIDGSGIAGIDENFAEDDLTFSGDRTHNIGNRTMTLDGVTTDVNFTGSGNTPISVSIGSGALYALEIDNNSQVWRFGMDASGNAILRDVTGGFFDVFEVEPGAPVNSLTVENTGQIRLADYTTGGGNSGAEVGLIGHTSNGTLTSVDLGTDGQYLTMNGTGDFTWVDGPQIDGLQIDEESVGVVSDATELNFQAGFDIQNIGGGQASILHQWSDFTAASVETDHSFAVYDAGSGVNELVSDDNLLTWINANISGGSSEWTLSGSTLHPNSTATQVSIGNTSADNDVDLHVEESSGDAIVRLESSSAISSDQAILSLVDEGLGANITFTEQSAISTQDSELEFSLSGQKVIELDEEDTWSENAVRLVNYGGYRWDNIAEVTSNVTLDEGHGIVWVTSSATVNLPQGNITNSNWIGTQYLVFNNSGGNILVDPGNTSGTCGGTTGTDCINGIGSNYVIPDGESALFTLIQTNSFASNEWSAFGVQGAGSSTSGGGLFDIINESESFKVKEVAFEDSDSLRINSTTGNVWMGQSNVYQVEVGAYSGKGGMSIVANNSGNSVSGLQAKTSEGISRRILTYDVATDKVIFQNRVQSGELEFRANSSSGPGGANEASVAEMHYDGIWFKKPITMDGLPTSGTITHFLGLDANNNVIELDTSTLPWGGGGSDGNGIFDASNQGATPAVTQVITPSGGFRFDATTSGRPLGTYELDVSLNLSGTQSRGGLFQPLSMGSTGGLRLLPLNNTGGYDGSAFFSVGNTANPATNAFTIYGTGAGANSGELWLGDYGVGNHDNNIQTDYLLGAETGGRIQELGWSEVADSVSAYGGGGSSGLSVTIGPYEKSSMESTGEFTMGTGAWYFQCLGTGWTLKRIDWTCGGLNNEGGSGTIGVYTDFYATQLLDANATLTIDSELATAAGKDVNIAVSAGTKLYVNLSNAFGETATNGIVFLTFEKS